ncbi:MAG: TlpA family protein disulfide reductase [Caldimicrobium sp.]|nr:TlpA family protein disulfide reductase [Caldimicrobium sp.]MCX7613635.1 TlpA family protein disulfide reductase [Caldimicrobium sp.]MDW8183115.1 TlpA disulfide reductase family protein [Caldimicrobium sp.]
MKKKIALFLGVSLIMFYLTFPFSLQASTGNLSFNSYDGKKYHFADFKGKYILLNLFSSYCPPCMVELKVLQKLNETCDNNGLQIISLMIDRDGAPLLPKIVSSRNLTYPVGLANQDILKLFSDFSITPTTYLLDPQGKRIEKFVGYKNYKEWTQALSKYVKCN